MHDKGQNLGYQSLTVSSTAAVSLTVPSSGNVDGMLIRVEGQNIRFRLDGTAATTGTTGGLPYLTTDFPLWLEGLGLPLNFSAISTNSAGATLHVLYFGCAQ